MSKKKRPKKHPKPRKVVTGKMTSTMTLTLRGLTPLIYNFFRSKEAFRRYSKWLESSI
jgi:hypothetical protein